MTPSAQPRIVVTGAIPACGVEMLRRHGEVVVWDDDVSEAQTHQDLRSARAAVTLLSTPVDAAWLDHAPQLEVVANVAVGYNNIDVAECTRRGVTVTNTPGVLTDATADVAMALIVMVTRRLGEAERLVRSGRPWGWSMSSMLGRSIAGCVLGVVGMGQIGTATARRARAFGMRIVYHNRRPSDAAAELGAARVGLEELLATADVVSLHTPYTEDSHHLIDAEALALMRPDAYVVNTSRGAVVDEEALVDALAAGRLAGAGLDVFEHEPSVHPGLLALDNVVLLPHVGSATVEARDAMALLAARNVIAVLAGRPPETPVSV